MGNMGKAIIDAWLETTAVELFVIYDIDSDKLSPYAKNKRIRIVSSIQDVAAAADCLLLAVKPHQMMDVCSALDPFQSQIKCVISIAAGISLAQICSTLPNVQVIRVMPNTPLLVQAGAGALCTTDHNALFEECLALFRKTGEFYEVSESLFDVITGLSGSGPAYVFLMIEALSDGAVKMGLPREISYKLAAQTVYGAAKLMLETGKHPGELKDMVTSPGGTTIAAISALEKGKTRFNFMRAVERATERSKELGKKD